MIFRNLLNFIAFLTSTILFSQSYAPPAGQTGSTALAADSDVFVNWATQVEVERGFINIEDPSAQDQGSSYASYGEPNDAVGIADELVVSLGDAGQAILTFENPISNGSGYDFAVFENSFSDAFLELAFVAVSSDGENYFRFPSHSQTQTETQVGGFGSIDATYLNNLAGKYRANFGTPFDLSNIDDDPLLDKNSITHIKIIDVVGTINPNYASYDSLGNIINDPFPTQFYSSGFDLNAVGVIHEKNLGNDKFEKNAFKIYPNPAQDYIYFDAQINVDTIYIYSSTGSLISEIDNSAKRNKINIIKLPKDIYFVKFKTAKKSYLYKFIKE